MGSHPRISARLRQPIVEEDGSATRSVENRGLRLRSGTPATVAEAGYGCGGRLRFRLRRRLAPFLDREFFDTVFFTAIEE